VCGYFSTTADRLAYGCYPENRNRDDVGYGFHFLRALRRDGDFDEAHRSALVNDDSPDVPLRTSDAYLENIVREAAAAEQQDAVAFTDALLTRAFIDRTRWEGDIRLLDGIGHRYGIFSPRRLSEVEERLKVVPTLADELNTHRDNWGRSCGSASTANLDRFLAGRTDWRTRLAPDALRDLLGEQRRTLREQVLTDLEAFTKAEEPVHTRLASLHDRSEAAGALGYRMETRVGVLMRMRLLLFRIAGMHYLETRGTDAQRATLNELLACEQLRIPVRPPTSRGPRRKDPFPSFEDDLAASQRVVPGWLGVQFRPVGDRTRRALSVDVGAATVQAVYPNSPAQEAGLEIGDVIMGPPGSPFTEHQQLREWVMTSTLGQPSPLQIMRGGMQRQVTLTLRAYPRVWPKLPGPPKAGSVAPALGLTPYRGTPPTQLAGRRKTLLFFWATWCGICKAALPALEDAGRRLGVEVVAITDEEPEQLDAFFSEYRGPFPPVVAIDESRRSFLAYGVSGTPTFVLIDAAGRIVRQKVGYARTKGLEVLQDS
jgi:thiol-disulfide isomerase/thioredoxin